jgi:lactate dehydrogenase-like 2-hydroxyacid dehydrogenase
MYKMAKVYSAARLPEKATQLFDDAGIEWEMFDELDTPSEEEINQKAQDADVLISAVNVPVSDKIINDNTHLKAITNVGAGFNNIQIETAAEHGIPVTNTPGRNSLSSTAEHAAGLMLALSRRYVPNHKMMERNEYPGWQVTGYTGGNQVYGKTIGIIGMGGIGQIIGEIASSLDMEVLYSKRSPLEGDYDERVGATRVSQEELLERADYVILMANYAPENHHMIDKEQFDKMKETAYFINAARGGMVNEEALADALEAGELAGAALDVHEHEPKVNERLAKMENVLLTPHIGNDTIEARLEMAETAVGQAIKAIQGEELDHVVNDV